MVSGGTNSICGTLPSMESKKTWEISCSGKSGTKVMIQIPGSNKALTLCEVEVWGTVGGRTGNFYK